MLLEQFVKLLNVLDPPDNVLDFVGGHQRVATHLATSRHSYLGRDTHPIAPGPAMPKRGAARFERDLASCIVQCFNERAKLLVGRLAARQKNPLRPRRECLNCRDNLLGLDHRKLRVRAERLRKRCDLVSLFGVPRLFGVTPRTSYRTPMQPK
jgi:hypothetical protein